ncbi:MAG: hypothetical protein II992_08675 [Lachnospiraceae bacterium]|nr:hypothetical protein [Lachnospiraceae bacterium]
MEELKKLIDLKTIITLLLTIVFVILVVFQIPMPEFFIEIYRLLIVFYFGTQVQKTSDYIKNLKENTDKQE